MSYSIVFCHVGESLPPQHLYENLQHLSEINNDLNITLISNNYHHDFHLTQLNFYIIKCKVTFVSIEEIPSSAYRKSFQNNSSLDKSFRNGFWFNASFRFLIIADYIYSNDLTNVLHLENDYVLFIDPVKIINKSINYFNFMTTFDDYRAIPGIVWFKDKNIALQLSEFIARNSDNDDMQNLNNFALSLSSITSFPTIPEDICNKFNLDIIRFGSNQRHMDGIFDAAAIGQYVGGVHWLNDPTDSVLFQNESSSLKLKDFDINWDIIDYNRVPSLNYYESKVNILGIHVHSKNISEFSIKNHGLLVSISDYITSNGIQSIANLTIATEEIIRNQGIDNIRSDNIWMIQKNKNGHFLPPIFLDIEYIQESKIIFVYGEILNYFSNFIANRLKHKYILITDFANTQTSYNLNDLLNSYFLKAMYTQYCDFSHEKLFSIPTGIKNNGHLEDYSNYFSNISKTIIKSNLIYLDLSLEENKEYKLFFQTLKDVNFFENDSYRNFHDYLLNLSTYKFCICFNNHLKPNQFWDCQYLDVIPIILQKDWNRSYSNLPILILNNWTDLLNINLIEKYHKIKLNKYNFNRLKLSYYKSIISA
jgi:hypothetical protein